jgi:hypothetical protein
MLLGVAWCLMKDKKIYKYTPAERQGQPQATQGIPTSPHDDDMMTTSRKLLVS